MKTIKTLLNQLTDGGTIMESMKDTLREIDPGYRAEEERYLRAAAALTAALGDSVVPTASEYLAALEGACAAALVYIGWLGFQLNLDIYHNPVNALLLRGDFEDLHRERRLHTIPGVGRQRITIQAFHDALRGMTDETMTLVEDITGYYNYLSTVGYKAAHYFGFRFADRFLHHVIPGYADDSVHTMQYKLAIREALGIDPELLE